MWRPAAVARVYRRLVAMPSTLSMVERRVAAVRREVKEPLGGFLNTAVQVAAGAGALPLPTCIPQVPAAEEPRRT